MLCESGERRKRCLADTGASLPYASSRGIHFKVWVDVVSLAKQFVFVFYEQLSP